MTKLPPSPFLNPAEDYPLPADTAAASASPREAAAGLLDDHRFALDEEAFMEALKEPLPVFLTAPSAEYLDALMDLAAVA